jgi:hypothetical protein
MFSDPLKPDIGQSDWHVRLGSIVDIFGVQSACPLYRRKQTFGAGGWNVRFVRWSQPVAKSGHCGPSEHLSTTHCRHVRLGTAAGMAAGRLVAMLRVVAEFPN